ncbi:MULTISPECIES: hypothetical protein [unclassified Imperialibacter]|nr:MULTISPECIES: hypothetical protein [unclassified Imperialibacter]
MLDKINISLSYAIDNISSGNSVKLMGFVACREGKGNFEHDGHAAG